MISPAALYGELMETFCGGEFCIKQAKETLSGSSRRLTEYQRVALNWKCLKIAQVALAVFMPTSPTGHPLIAFEAELGKAVLLFKVSLIAAVDVIPPVDSFYAVNSGNPLSAKQ